MSVSRMPATAIGLALTVLAALVAAQPAAIGGQTGSASSPTTGARPASASADSSWTQAPEATQAPPAAPTPAAAPAPAAPTPAAAPVETTQAAPVSSIETPTTPPPAPAGPKADTLDEPPTLFNGKSVKLGGYGGIGVRYARIHGEDGVLTGVEGALLLDHRFAIGVAGYSWANQQRVRAGGTFVNPYLHYGYGGLLVRYHVYVPGSPVYFSAAALIGGGAIGLTNTWDGNIYRENSDVFFVCEPQVGIHVNFTRWMRAGLDAGYRVHSGIGKFGYTESDFNGVSLGGNIQFGWL